MLAHAELFHRASCTQSQQGALLGSLPSMLGAYLQQVQVGIERHDQSNGGVAIAAQREVSAQTLNAE